MHGAEQVLTDMIQCESAQPDAVTFSMLMDLYARSKHANSSKRCLELFYLMDELNVRKNVYTFGALQNVFARSGDDDAAEKTEAVLQQLLRLYEEGDVFAKPLCYHYNCVLDALARTRTRKAAEKAQALLDKMEASVEEGGYDVQPDRGSYSLTILAYAQCPDLSYGAKHAERLLERLEQRSMMEARHRANVSSVAPPVVHLDVGSFNVVAHAISASRDDDASERIIRIIKRMDEYVFQGQDYLRPTVRTWNALLNSLSRATVVRDRLEQAKRAEKVLDHIITLHESGVPNVKPNEFTFSAVLSAFRRSSDPEALQRADGKSRTWR
jgi:hypothetical protein